MTNPAEGTDGNESATPTLFPLYPSTIPTTDKDPNMSRYSVHDATRSTFYEAPTPLQAAAQYYGLGTFQSMMRSDAVDVHYATDRRTDVLLNGRVILTIIRSAH